MTQTIIGRGVSVTYYGHSAFKLSGGGVSVAIDPWLSNPLLQTPVEQVGQVDLILVTHGHGDHVGETVPLAQKTGATVVAIHELSQILAEQGVAQVVGMNKGGTVALAGLKITMTQAVHSSTMAVGGKMVPAGEAGGFVVQFPNGFTVYHAGDTAVFSGHGAYPGALPAGTGPAAHRQPLRHEPARRRPWPAGSSSPNGSFPCTMAPSRCSPARRRS